MIRITYFVHGTTTDNEQNLATGWAEGELSEKGRQQTLALAEQVASRSFDAVFCSDLKRAVDSASLIFGNRFPVHLDARLREAHYGDFTGQPAHSFKDDLQHYIDTPFPNGECYRDIEKRIDSFLDFLKRHYPGKSIAIVAHQAPQLALEVLTCGKTWKQAIAEDWRHTKSWKPGWNYTAT